MFYLDFSSLLYAIFIVAVIATLVQSVYYLYVFYRIARFRKNKYPVKYFQDPVSVIICARNESENLSKYLPLVLQQNYPDYEVIVVNDCSDDNSQDILENLQLRFSNLKITQIKHDEKFTHGKKLALTVGIKAAKNEWLLLTDADCKPESNQWISTMQQNFTDDTDIVLGYGGYLPLKGFLNKLIRYDTFFIALQYMSFALVKLPYMGVGRNLAYRKSVYLKNKGFASHAHIVSGDDDLFINEVTTARNTRVEFSAEAHTRSIPKNTLMQWANQKKRHLTTWGSYKYKHKVFLSIEIFSRFLVYMGIILLIINPLSFITGATLLIIRWVIMLIVFYPAMKKLDEKKILLFSVLFDVIIPLLNLFLYFVNRMNSKRHQWK